MLCENYYCAVISLTSQLSFSLKQFRKKVNCTKGTQLIVKTLLNVLIIIKEFHDQTSFMFPAESKHVGVVK